MINTSVVLSGSFISFAFGLTCVGGGILMITILLVFWCLDDHCDCNNFVICVYKLNNTAPKRSETKLINFIIIFVRYDILILKKSIYF